MAISNQQSEQSPPQDRPAPAAPPLDSSAPNTAGKADQKAAAFQRDLKEALQASGKGAEESSSSARVGRDRDQSGKFTKGKGDDGKGKPSQRDAVSDDPADTGDADEQLDEPEDGEPEDESDDDGNDAGAHVDSVALSDARAAWKAGDLSAVAEALGEDPAAVKDKIDGRAFRALQKQRKAFEDEKTDWEGKLGKAKSALEEERRLIDRGYSELNPIVRTINAAQSGDRKAAIRGVELLLKKPLAQIAREYYEEIKTGPEISRIERENADLRARLEKLEGKGKDDSAAAGDGRDDKAEQASFEKAFAKHPLARLEDKGDDSLRKRAYKLRADSWDPDLQTYQITRKQALDQVLEREQKRAQRLTANKGTRQRRSEEPASTEKAYDQMSKEEKRAYDARRALEQVASTRAAGRAR